MLEYFLSTAKADFLPTFLSTRCDLPGYGQLMFIIY